MKLVQIDQGVKRGRREELYRRERQGRGALLAGIAAYLRALKGEGL
jgi:hypothetical protein